MRLAPWLLALGVAGLLAPAPVAAQPVDCEWLPGTRNVTGRDAGDSRIVYVSNPRIRCNDGRYIEADSLISYETGSLHQLIGNVYFQDASQALRSINARYYDRLGRLDADGDVELTDRQSGNVLRGQRLIYLQQTATFPREELTMSGDRPTAILYPEAVAGAENTEDAEVVPYEVVADRHFLMGDDLMLSTGSVALDRDSLHAVADSMVYDRTSGQLYLNQNARLRQEGMDLSARHLHLLLPGGALEEIRATEEAFLIGDDLELEAPTIRLFMTDDELDRLVAIAPPIEDPAQDSEPALPVTQGEEEPVDSTPPPPRAQARSSTLTMTADSLEVLAPGEVLERMTAAGSARAVSSARDSLNTEDTPEIARTDWIEGDTVVALFVPDTTVTPAPGERRPYLLERLEAAMNARSLYRMEPDTTAAAAPAPDPTEASDTTAASDSSAVRPPPLPLHYVEANRIVILLERGEVILMEVTGLQRGLYLTPDGTPLRATGTGGGEA